MTAAPAALGATAAARPGAGGSRVDGVLLALMVVALSVQGPTLFALGGMEFTVGHALVGLVGAAAAVRCLLSGNRLALPTAPINVLLVAFAVITVADASAHGFGSMILKYVFQYLVLVVTLNLMVLVGPGRSERMVLAGALAALALVLLNAAANLDAFLEYYDHPWDGHPNFATVFSGGVNLEATWPAMLGVFCENDRLGRGYLAAVFAFAALVQSRAGLMLAACAVVYVALLRDGRRPNVRRVVVAVGAVVLAVVLAAAGPRAIGAAQAQQRAAEQAAAASEQAEGDGSTKSVERSDGERSGSKSATSPAKPKGTPGRKGIWAGAIEAFGDAPLLGYGAGNAMDAVRSVTGYPYREDNVHNYPLQVLMDFGLVGFAVFAVVTLRFLWRGARARFRSPFAAFILLYLIGGLIQFRGGELLVGFALAGLVAFGYDLCGGAAARATRRPMAADARRDALPDGGEFEDATGEEERHG